MKTIRPFIAAVLAVSFLSQSVHAYPGDVFASAAPVQAPVGAAVGAVTAGAGHSVSDDGAARFSMPLPVAPGRNGMAPDLALSYSSRGATRGGVAVGWSLDVPVIERDTSRGRLAHRDFLSTLSRGRLVRVGAEASVIPGFVETEEYRAREDAGGTRYQRLVTESGTVGWRAYTTDGLVYHFGETSASKDEASWATWGIPVQEGRFYVTRIVDRFGNEIEFTYEKVEARLKSKNLTVAPVDIALVRVDYGKNVNAGLSHNARLLFDYPAALDRCPGSEVPIGAQFDYRTGFPLYRGARRLEAVRLEVQQGATWVQRHMLDLAYDPTELTCQLDGKLHAPLRVLTSITESAAAPNGTLTTLPATVFEYGRRQREFTRAVEFPGLELGSGLGALSDKKGGGWPTLDSMLLDLDGDGVLDNLASRRGESGQDPKYCEAKWQPGTGGPFWSPWTSFGMTVKDRPADHLVLPVIPWDQASRATSWDTGTGMEDCSLSAQFSREANVDDCGYAANYLSYRFMDVNNDGLPDLVTGIDAQRGKYRPEEDARLWPNTASCLDPLACSCSDQGSCVDEDGGAELCPIIDASPAVFFLGEEPTCQYACCAPGESGSNVPSEHSEPIQAESENEGSGFTSFFRWIGSIQGPLQVAPQDESTGENQTSSHHGDPFCQMFPETRCGHYVLRVHDNLGGGQFSTKAREIMAPIPLETDRPTSQLGAGRMAASSSWHGFVDLDGDGLLDAIHKQPDWAASGDFVADNEFRVFRGYGPGNFDDNAYAWPATATTPGNTRVHVGGDRTDVWTFAPATDWREREPMTTPAITAQYTSTTLTDVNGDGLADYVEARESPKSSPPIPRRIRVLYNTGTGFEPTLPWYPSTTLHELGDSSLKWLDEEQIWQDRVAASNAPSRAFSRATWRTVDLDADGLDDIVKLPPIPPDLTYDARPFTSGAGGWKPEVYFNVGDGYVRATKPPIATIWPALARIRVTHPDSGYMQGSWQVLSDFVDLDGDGLPEAVNNDTNGNLDCGVPWDLRCHTVSNAALTDPDDGQALRALRTVRTSQGSTVRFSYDPIRTPAGGVPHPVWAVTSMTVSPGANADGVAQADLVTSYSYDHAEYNQDLEERWAFRGFGVVAVTSPSGARAVTTHDFSQDYAGLVVDSRVYDGAFPTHVDSLTTHQYEERRVFGQGGPWPGPDEVITWHEVERLHRTCGALQDEEQCADDGVLLRTSTSWNTLAPDSGGRPMVHVAERIETSPGYGQVEGAVIRASYGRLISEGDRYWLVTELDRLRSRGPNGTMVVESETVTWFDPTWRAPIYSSIRIDAGTFAFTTLEFDLSTGNLRRMKSPRFLMDEVWTTYDHDATKRFVTRTTNGLGHVVDQVTDAATGVVVESRGPNQVARSCTGCEATPREGWRKMIDGLGRTVTEDAWIDDAFYGYKLVPTARYTYSDTPSPWISVTAEERNDPGSGMWTKRVVQRDGLGREVRVSTYEGATVQALSRSYYDTAGNLVLARLPKPGGYSPGSYVDWKYAYDRLGRLTAAREPSRFGCTGEIGSTTWCGLRWSYDGQTMDEQNVVGGAGGQIGRTRTTHDALGRLARVDEMQTSGAWATTSYRHDGRGNVLTTTNADGVTTASTYDLAGHRRTSSRGGKTWTYGYDGDGNLTSVQSPVPAGGAVEDYVSTIGYDVLGRISSEVAAPRGGADPMLGAATVVRGYDHGVNGLGRLTNVSQDTQKLSLSYDALGNVSGETHSFDILDGQFSDQRTISRRYGLHGHLLEVTAADDAAPSSATRFTYQYNGRGLPAGAHWWSGSTYKGLLEQVMYNASGYPYVRRVTSGSAVVAEGQTVWDDAGRTQIETVSSRLPGAISATQRAYQRFTFDGASDVSSLRSALSAGATSAPLHQANYTYDRMHRLVTATGPVGYTGAFAYSPGGRITAANVNADTNAARVHRRNVSYVYGADGADPDAPTQLDRVAGGKWMTIAYDTFGNATRRVGDGQIYTHTYDGVDRQRIVARADGSREVYWYGADGKRSIVATMSAVGVVQRVKWTVGEAEIWYDGSGHVEKEVAHAAVGSATSRIEDQTRRELLYHDSRGHLMAVVGDDGALAAGFRFGPYGELLEQIGPEHADYLKRFNGKEYDATSGLSYYGARYFDERTLTWTQADPKYRATVDAAGVQPRRASLYAFSLGNPVSMVDPDGADPGKFRRGADQVFRKGKAVRGLAKWIYGSFALGTYIAIKYDIHGTEAKARAAQEVDDLNNSRRHQVQDAVSSLVAGELERRQAANPDVNVEMAKGAEAKILAAVNNALQNARPYDGCVHHCGNTSKQHGSGAVNADGSLNWAVDDLDRKRAIEAAAAVVAQDSTWVEEAPGESYPEGHPLASETVDPEEEEEPIEPHEPPMAPDAPAR